MNITSDPQLSADRSRPQFHICLGDDRPALHAIETPIPAIPRTRIRNPAKLLPAGKGFVQIFGRAPGPFTIAWRETEDGPRLRAMRSTWPKAKAFAETKRTELANRQTGIRELTPIEASSYLRCLEIVAPTGKQLELIAAEYAEGDKLLAGAATIIEAIRFFTENQPSDVVPKNVPEIITLLLDHKKRDGNGAKGLRMLSHQLGIFSARFPGPLHLVRAPEIKAWEYSLKGGLRTRKNYRAAVKHLVRFAQDNNFLPRTWDELSRLDKIKPPPTEAFLWTPKKLTLLLSNCHPKLIPLLVLMAFGGVRHEEMSPEARDEALLDWSNINLDTGLIRVPKTVAKTKRMRLIKMQPNLIAWLRPYARRTGPICELKCTGDALYRLGKRTGISWVKNACRNSFISYRVAQTNDIALVAREAGNSARMIADEYLELATQEQGKAWFAIFPPVADPLFDWATAQAKRPA